MVFDLRWEIAGEQQLRRRFVGLERAFSDFSEPFEEMMGVVEDENEHQFAEEGDPAWPELSEAYEARKRRIWGDQPILVASDALHQSLVDRNAPGAVAEVTPTMMRRGTRIQVGRNAQHNLGLVQFHGTRDGRIPARQMMRLRENAQRRMVRIFDDFFYRAGEGAQP